MKKNDELDEIRVGLLPERFLASPEEVIQERSDVVGQSVRVEIVVQGIVPILGIEADFDVVFGPAVACEDFIYPVAEVPFYFEDEPTDPLFRVTRTVGENLLGERIHAATRFPTPDCAKDGNAREQTPFGDHE